MMNKLLDYLRPLAAKYLNLLNSGKLYIWMYIFFVIVFNIYVFGMWIIDGMCWSCLPGLLLGLPIWYLGYLIVKYSLWTKGLHFFFNTIIKILNKIFSRKK